MLLLLVFRNNDPALLLADCSLSLADEWFLVLVTLQTEDDEVMKSLT